MSDLPVFIDGPLKGRADIPIDAHARKWGLMWQPLPVSEPVVATDLIGGLPEPVCYRFSDVPFFGRTVIIGSVAQPPDCEALFEALASDQAKASARFRG